jgi:hypothetical protein
LLVRWTDTLLPAFRLVGDRVIGATRKSRDGVGNGVVEATVERAKFVYGNGGLLVGSLLSRDVILNSVAY